MSSSRLIAALAALVFAVLVVATPAAALAPAGGAWYWQDPQPAGWQFRQLTFAGDAQVWALTADDALLHSTDSGGSWSRVDAGPRDSLHSLSFPDAGRGRMLGDVISSGAHALVYSDDGGATWAERLLPLDLRSTAAGADFVDADHGWVAGADSPRKQPARGFVLRTSDGGVTWAKVLLPVGEVSLVDFVDVTHGWAAGSGRVFVTRDGGDTWRGVRCGAAGAYQGWRLQAASPELAYYVALDSDGNGALFAVRTDGGALRTTRLSPGGGSIQQAAADRQGHVWAVLVDPTSGEPGTSVARSDDGGVSWSKVFVGGLWASDLAVNGAGTLLAADWHGEWRSDDGGATWERVTGAAGGALAAIDALADGEVWAVGSDDPAGALMGSGDGLGMILHSPDGVRWLEQGVPQGPALNAVSFVDARHGWAAGEEGRVLRTEDGGATWEAQSAGTSDLRDIQFRSETLGWAVGEGAWWTEDGGATWHAAAVPDNVTLASLCFVDSAHGWAVGVDEEECANGVMLRTADGGRTWVRQELSGGWWLGGAMHDVTFVDRSHGWAVGGDWWMDGYLYRTSDGGATWERISLPKGPSPAALCFTDATHGLGVGERLWRTADGGTTWKVEASGFAAGSAGPTLWGIDAADADRTWAVGAAGVILSTVDSADDTAAPSTVDDGDRSWHRGVVTVHLRATDIGASGVARTEYRVDGETTWREGEDVTFNAPRDHRGDGEHWITYRSVDAAGNVERARTCPVLIDTRGPQTWAHAAREVAHGATVRFAYRVNDLLSPCASLRLVIYDYRGGSSDGQRVRKLIQEAQVRTGRDQSLRFRLDVPAGDYWYDLYASDLAGNACPYPYHGMFKVR
jgi:photosystem II stability/assembly factor-like uncharacterized protein